MSRKVQVIGAHSADFVWRAGGAVAKAVENGGTAEVIALSYGERGESGELWKQEGQTVENVKRDPPRRGRGGRRRAGRELPLPGPRRLPAADRRRRAQPDRRRHPRLRARRAHHPHRSRPVQPRPPGRLHRGRPRPRPGGRRGVQSGFATVSPPALFLFEPHQPELCNFTPTTFVDITLGDREEAGGDGRDEGPGSTCRPTTPSAPSSAPTTRGVPPATSPSSTPRPSSA